jgi:hypothetical protein
MANVFKKEEIIEEKSVVEIIRDSLDVDATGAVRFKSRIGRGSGKAIEIPGDQFDEFVNLILKAKEARVQLAEQEQNKIQLVAEEKI